MTNTLFEKLVDGMEEAVAIHKGEQTPAGATIYFEPEEIKAIRTSLDLSQTEFSNRTGIPVATIRHWEQGDRRPDRAAVALYQILNREPEIALQALAYG